MVKNKPLPGEGQSLEDVIISEYLDELRKTHTAGAKPAKSPYAQRFPATPYDAVLNRERPRARTASARQSSSARPRSRSGSRSRTDVREAWSGDVAGGYSQSVEDPDTEKDKSKDEEEGEDSILIIDATGDDKEDEVGQVPTAKRRTRPGSAPVHGRRRIHSLHSDSAISLTDSYRSRPLVRKRRRRAPLYMRQPDVFLVTAFINGRRDVHCRIAAPNVAMLLDQSTAKLQLPSAARRVFLPDGSEVHRDGYIPRDTEVYISMGEPFKNPFKSVRRIQELKEISTWTMTGLQMPSDRPRLVTKPRMSKRFRGLNERKKRRLLVFKNGVGTEPLEIVVDPDDIQGLFEACTLKFSMGSFARKIYIWNGTEVENLHEVPEMHRLIQGCGGTPVLGPVWVSRGEGFSPAGSENYLCDVIQGLLAKLKTSQRYQEQLEFARDGKTEEIRLTSILSLSEEEVEEALNHVREDISEHRQLLKEYRRMRSEISEIVNRERDVGNEYTMKHIEPLDFSNRLVGTKGLRLKVYENGNYDTPTTVYFNLREAARGVKNNKLQFERLLDHCSYNCHLASQNNQARGMLAKRCFNRYGREITELNQLSECQTSENDFELWLSYGEAWIDPNTYCLGVQLSKVRRIEKKDKTYIVTEDISGDLREGMEKPSAWECVRGVPGDVATTKEYSPEPEDEYEDEEPPSFEPEEEQEPSGHIGEEHFFLQFKKSPELVLFAESDVAVKRRPNDTELFPKGSQSQNWLLNQDGNIYLKSLPHLALGISDYFLRTRLPNGHEVTGYLLTLMEKSDTNPSVRWSFESDGRVYCMANQALALTYLGVPVDNPEATQPVNSESGVPPGLHSTVAACEVVSGKVAKYQRWGMKQERFDVLGQWKHNCVTNPDWNKRALTWPLDENGRWNTKLEWPMEGYLIPCAPPLEPKKNEGGPMSMVPKRLFALKNGMRDVKKAVPVTGPDLTNMVRDRSLANMKKGKKKRGKSSEEGKPGGASDSVDGVSMHCTDMTLVDLEFKLFLERCTGLLSMSSAARRIFDSRGIEHFSLQDFDRDELIFVTAGESWSDPTLSKEEIKRRQLICMIADDVDRVRQFVQLRAPEKLVLAAEGGLGDGVHLIVSPEIGRKRRRHKRAQQSPNREASSPTRVTSTDDSSDEDSGDDVDLTELTAHDRACQKADERLNRLKWPWERIVATNGLDEVAEANTAPAESDRKRDGDARSRKKGISPRFNPRHLQRFGYEDNFIFPLADPNLVLTAADTEGRVVDVLLQKRRPDTVNQRWLMKPNGFIYAKYRSNQVLTVSMPKASATAGQVDLTFPGCTLTLQPVRNVQFGRANQQFCFNPINGVIHAFHSSTLDKEILAANTVNVCTYTIVPDEIDQMGYLVYLPTTENKVKACHVCLACARSLRGRFKLQKVEPGSLDFACCFGDPKRHGIRERGALRCLGGKLDLSTGEAQATLDHWEETLRSLRTELNVKRVQSRLAESRTPRPVRVLAYRNGEGRLGNPELIVGSSMRGLMDQCMHRLGLPRAVRRLYTEDGTPLVELDDLRNWYTEHRNRVHLRQRQIQEGEMAPEVAEIRDEVALMMEAMAQEEAEKNEPALPEKGSEEGPEMNLEPVLNSDEGFYEIGPVSKKTSIYELSITVTELGKLDKLLPENLLANTQTSFTLSFSLFGVDISSDPFLNEEHYSAERTTIRLRAELGALKQFFRKHFTRLEFELRSAAEEEDDEADESAPRGSRLGVCAVPLTSLIPRDCPDLFRPVSSEGIFPFHQPGPGGAEGAKTEALLCVELKLVREPDLECDSNPDEGKPTESQQTAGGAAEGAEGADGRPPSVADEMSERGVVDVEDDSDLGLSAVVIEVWASTGEPFIPLKTVYNDYRQMLRQRAARQGVSMELDTQKHVLRHMQGRRLEHMSPGDYRATMDPENPVLIQGNWQHPNTAEQLKNDAIHNLQGRLDEIKVRQTITSSRAMRVQVNPNRELYQQPSMKRVLIFPNGEDARQAVYVWGESLHQLMDNAVMRLGLRKNGRCLYTMEGKRIREFDEIERDQMVCISTGESFMKPKTVHEQVEVRANWSRARRMYGTKATEVAVLSRPNAAVGVDPFGPPGLVRRPDPPPTFENKRVLVYENGKHKEDAVTVFGDCLDALLTNATRRLGLRKPAICFYNSKGEKIMHFDDVSRDEVLAVSTSGKSFIK